jgi:hypothetical protein
LEEAVDYIKSKAILKERIGHLSFHSGSSQEDDLKKMFFARIMKNGKTELVIGDLDHVMLERRD